jgi:hypothetical protein
MSTTSPSKAARRLLALAKYRAKKQGVLFDLTADDIHIPHVCPALGIRLVRNIGGRSQSAASPTLDRITPALGYVRGNVIVLSSKANAIKQNASPKELERVAAFCRQLVA